MNYSEFSHIFLPQLAKEYREGTLPFHALVDIDLWRQVFPDMNAKPGQVQWYTIKLNAYSLNDDNNSLLLTYSLPERREKEEAKFIGLRINNINRTLTYYILRRPSVVDEHWDLYQYNFAQQHEDFVQKIQTTDSLREFRNCIEHLSQTAQPGESLISLFKKHIDPRNILTMALS